MKIKGIVELLMQNLKNGLFSVARNGNKDPSIE